MCLVQTPLRLCALVYSNKFTRDAIHECGEASLRFPTRFSLEEYKNKVQVQKSFNARKKEKISRPAGAGTGVETETRVRYKGRMG